MSPLLVEHVPFCPSGKLLQSYLQVNNLEPAAHVLAEALGIIP